MSVDNMAEASHKRFSNNRGDDRYGRPEGGVKLVLQSEYIPSGDQPQAIHDLSAGIHAGEKDQVLLGVTGSGKTYTMMGTQDDPGVIKQV